MDFRTNISLSGKLWVTNTGLTQLVGLNLYSAAAVTIESNSRLVMIDLSNLTSVTGVFTLTSGQPVPLDLSALLSVGSLSLSKPGAINVSNLRSVAGFLRIWDSDIQELIIDGLTTINGDLQLSENWALTSVAFPSLLSVGGSLLVFSEQAEAENLTTIAFSELRTVGGTFNIITQVQK